MAPSWNFPEVDALRLGQFEVIQALKPLMSFLPSVISAQLAFLSVSLLDSRYVGISTIRHTASMSCCVPRAALINARSPMLGIGWWLQQVSCGQAHPILKAPARQENQPDRLFACTFLRQTIPGNHAFQRCQSTRGTGRCTLKPLNLPFGKFGRGDTVKYSFLHDQHVQ